MDELRLELEVRMEVKRKDSQQFLEEYSVNMEDYQVMWEKVSILDGSGYLTGSTTVWAKH